MRTFTLLIALSSLLVVSASCSSSSSSSKTVTSNTPDASASNSPAASKSAAASTSPAAAKTPTAAGGKDETAFAKSMLLTAADFPAGYIETPSNRDAENNPLQQACGQAAEKGKTGRADGSDFSSSPDAASISETIIVFGKESDATAGINAIPALIDCAVQAVNAGKLNSNGVEFSGTTSEKIALDAPGDTSYAFVVRTTGNAPGQEGDLVLVFTLVYARKGRIGYQITVTGSGEPLDPAEIATYAQKAAAKVKQQP